MTTLGDVSILCVITSWMNSIQFMVAHWHMMGPWLPWSWIKPRANMGGKTQITSRENYRLLVSIGEASGGRRSEDPDKSEEWLGINFCFMFVFINLYELQRERNQDDYLFFSWCDDMILTGQIVEDLIRPGEFVAHRIAWSRWFTLEFHILRISTTNPAIATILGWKRGFWYFDEALHFFGVFDFVIIWRTFK